MSDIINKLRHGEGENWSVSLATRVEAADEIERLRAALREIVRASYWIGIEHGCPYIEWDNGDPEDIARAALGASYD